MFVVQAGLAMYNAQQRERLGDQVRMGEMLRSVSSAGQLAELDQSLYEASQALAKGPAAEHLSAAFGLDLSLERRHGRFSAFAR